MYDCHVHSVISFDSQVTMEQVCAELAAQGFDGLCFTEHTDFEYDLQPDHHILSDERQYRADFEAVKQQWGDRLEICKGMEIGLQAHVGARNRAYVAEIKPDFIIGSVHSIAGVDVYKGDFSRGKTQREAYLGYLEYVLRMVREQDYFHVLGHLDMILRDKTFEQRSFDRAEYFLLVDDILRELIGTGRGIEVNTSGFRYDLAQPHPSYRIIERYRALGGEIITCGSDGHRSYSVGQGIPDAYAHLRELGFAYVSFFVDGVEQKRQLK